METESGTKHTVQVFCERAKYICDAKLMEKVNENSDGVSLIGGVAPIARKKPKKQAFIPRKKPTASNTAKQVKSKVQSNPQNSVILHDSTEKIESVESKISPKPKPQLRESTLDNSVELRKSTDREEISRSVSPISDSGEEKVQQRQEENNEEQRSSHDGKTAMSASHSDTSENLRRIGSNSEGGDNSIIVTKANQPTSSLSQHRKISPKPKVKPGKRLSNAISKPGVSISNAAKSKRTTITTPSQTHPPPGSTTPPGPKRKKTATIVSPVKPANTVPSTTGKDKNLTPSPLLRKNETDINGTNTNMNSNTTLIPTYAPINNPWDLDPALNIPPPKENEKTLRDFCSSYRVKRTPEQRRQLALERERRKQQREQEREEAEKRLEKTLNLPLDDGNLNGNKKTSSGPEVEIINGEIRIREESLLINKHQTAEQIDAEMNHVLEEDSTTLTATYTSFTKWNKRTEWTVENTKLFYRALRQCGTDFDTMQSFFSGKMDRKQLKKKYLVECRRNSKLIDLAMNPLAQVPIGKFIIHFCLKQGKINRFPNFLPLCLFFT